MTCLCLLWRFSITGSLVNDLSGTDLFTIPRNGASLIAGLMERRNDGMAEWRNGGKSPQTLKDRIAESRSGGKYPQILKDGIAELRNGGKYPQILKDGITENQPNHVIDTTSTVRDICTLAVLCIGGFRGGAVGAAPPPFILPLTLRFCFENRFLRFNSIFRNVNVTLVFLTNTPTMLYAANPEKWCFHSGRGEDSASSFCVFWIRLCSGRSFGLLCRFTLVYEGYFTLCNKEQF